MTRYGLYSGVMYRKNREMQFKRSVKEKMAMVIIDRLLETFLLIENSLDENQETNWNK